MKNIIIGTFSGNAGLISTGKKYCGFVQ